MGSCWVWVEVGAGSDLVVVVLSDSGIVGELGASGADGAVGAVGVVGAVGASGASSAQTPFIGVKHSMIIKTKVINFL